MPYLLRHLYMTIREDRKWYLRTTLKNRCAETGGCCGQECNCCEKRLNTLQNSGMNGHCLWACPCCMKRKRFYPKVNEETIVEKQYKDALESENPAFLIYMADAYFSKLQKSLTLNDDSPAKKADSRKIGKGPDKDAKTPCGGGVADRVTNEPPNSNPPPYSATRPQKPKWFSTSSLQRHKSNK